MPSHKRSKELLLKPWDGRTVGEEDRPLKKNDPEPGTTTPGVAQFDPLEDTEKAH